MKNSAENIASYIDHTLLKPEATKPQIIDLCQQALTYHFAAVCINPIFVKLAAETLAGSPVHVCTVVGFPLGANTTGVTCYEAEEAIAAGASEIDMVIHIGALKNGDHAAVRDDIAAVAKLAHNHQAIAKVIIETALLTNEEKVIACQLAQKARANFVKTSTGFSSGGATLEDVALMRRTIGSEMGLKAAGGIRSYETALAMIEAGATRLGTSSGVKIMQEAQESDG